MQGSVLYNFSEGLKYFIIKRLKQNFPGNCNADSWHLEVVHLGALRTFPFCVCMQRTLSPPPARSPVLIGD